MSVHVVYPDLVCLSHLRWDFVFQRPQHLMVRWASERRVFFVEEPIFGSDTCGWRQRRCSRSPVHIATPLLPSNTENDKTLRRSLLDQLFAEHGIEDYLLWYYTPMALEHSDHLHPRRVIYDCMDELAAFKGAPPDIAHFERQLLARADVVFTGGYSLYEEKRRLHSNVHPFPSSVDVPHFRRARVLAQKSARTEPVDQAWIPRPRLGFYGVIDERLDLALIEELAAGRPKWHFVLVGPVAKISEENLPKNPNIHFLGMKSYDELPTYLAGWDVAILPFAKNASTRFISPTKTPEYLAGGKPVVSTSIRDVVRPYGQKGLVRIADTPQDFEAAITACLAEEAEAVRSRITRADEFLRDLSWDSTFSAMRRAALTSAWKSERHALERRRIDPRKIAVGPRGVES